MCVFLRLPNVQKCCFISVEGKTFCTQRSAVALQVIRIHQGGRLLLKDALGSLLQPDCRQRDTNLMQAPVCLQAGEARHQVKPTPQPVDGALQPTLHSSPA